jgi:SAM-dependent methyltransferase
MTTTLDLSARVEALAPWHHTVSLRGGVVTRSRQNETGTGERIMAYDPAQGFERIIGRIFPGGLDGRSFLDCGCNAGGFSVAARDNGAGRVFGFDARQHWIDQAEFIREARGLDAFQIRFEVATLEALDGHDQDYDITWFSGLFQHLPEPVAALKVAADRTRELLFLNTACLPATPNIPEDPTLLVQKERKDHPLSGIHGLGSIPSGPVVLKNILHWLGFVEVKTYLWNQPEDQAGLPQRGRVALVAARRPGLLNQVPDLTRANQPVAEAMTAQRAEPIPAPAQPGGDQRPLRWEDDLSVHSRDTASFDTIPPVSTWQVEDFRVVADQRGPEELRDLPILEMARRDTAPLPGTRDREGYCGDNHEWYWLSGLRDYHLVTQAMARHGAKVDRLLDIGCASGRVLRHFAFQSDVSELWGAEINHRHVRFLTTHMPAHVRPMAVPCLPHYPVEDNYFDLITAFSVFTHIDAFETAFLAEIRRALKPGGLAYLTVSDESHWQALRDGGQNGANLVKRISKHAPGFAETLKQPLGDLPRYYNHTDIGPYRGTIFTPQAHLRAVWERFFTFEEVIPQGHAQQTVVVLRK